MGLCPTMAPSTPFVQRPSFACRINQLPARENWPWPVDSHVVHHLFGDPEAVVNRKEERWSWTVLTHCLEMEQARIAPVPIQRIDAVRFRADNELNKGLNLGRSEQVAILRHDDESKWGIPWFGNRVN